MLNILNITSKIETGRPESNGVTRTIIKPLPTTPDGWSLGIDYKGDEKSSRLRREYKFDNFIDAFAFVSKVALVAEHRKHHPDITFSYGYVNLVITTHSAGNNLTPADYKLAEEINKVCESDNQLYVQHDLHGAPTVSGATRSLPEALQWKGEDRAYREIVPLNID